MFTPSKYREAKEHYDAVGTWLGEDDSELACYEPSIYPQGFILHLETAVKPLGDEEYDVGRCLFCCNSDRIKSHRSS